jgi:phosphate transport system permease protein
MTDLTVSTGVPMQGSPSSRNSAAAMKLRQKRHRANARFRAYGFAAIVLAVLFLAAILLDIFLKAAPAFTQSTLKLDVPLTSEFVDAANLRAGDYDGAVRSALRSLFPNSTSKAERKTINNLVSSSAGTPLQTQIAANPSLAGKTVTANVLLSSDADLYAKGLTVSSETADGKGTAKPSATSGAITLELAPDALSGVLAAQPKGPEGAAAFDTNSPSLLIAMNGGMIRLTSVKDGQAEGESLVPLTSANPATAGSWRTILLKTPEAQRKINDAQVAVLEVLKDKKLIGSQLNTAFFTRGDSREPELAGILGGLMGTAYTMLITLGLCLPIGLGAAIYLEEFAPRNRLTHLIEVNINNLAAVPSIVFGLLGLAVFLNVFGLPRSSPLVGGLVLALLVLPTIIIASRAALKSVPPSIREAAIGIGATRQQAVFHHVLPVAMPGILTGTIIGMAHALGETAPLLMIGMVAFITDVPKSPVDAATVLPVQIFLWSDLPEAGFQSKTAAAILVLLAFLVVMNGLAIWLRTKFERRW